MRCIVTAGPTYEPVDEVRRLTNFSTGRLGSLLADHLTAAGHSVTLLKGYYATYRHAGQVDRGIVFTTTADLGDRLRELSGEEYGAVFHAAAVSDFAIARVWRRLPGGEMQPVQAGKIPTREASLFAELRPTPKLIARLRAWYPKSLLVGWKYEVEGDRAQTVAKGRAQIADNSTDACVVNGRAYGPGFGLIARDGECAHCSGDEALFEGLARML